MDLLILEDEPIIAIDLEEIITDAIEVKILHACTLEQALAHLGEKGDPKIGFALLDLILGPDGLTSLDIAARLQRSQIPFCFLSSAPKVLPDEFQSVPWLPKPFDPNELTALIRAAISSNATTTPPPTEGTIAA